ncbi:hypothetical protein BRD00_11170 [Halobacteriales archaeon QS_8_69_26]|nr:MAG: hypothetical protein BRD00_11170 [Halobacteriales archaeon QS_8_69_26]
MVTVVLEDGETEEHDRIRIKGSLIIAFEVSEGGPPHAPDEDAVTVYPDGSVHRIDLDDGETMSGVEATTYDQYVIE